MNHHFKEIVFSLIDLENPPNLALHPRNSVFGVSTIRNTAVWAPSKRHDAILGLILLWHDHWAESHAITQTHEGVRDFDLLHAIGHRREGDYGNASYWFQAVGEHPMFGNLSARIEDSFKKDVDLLGKILPEKKWNPTAFVGLVKGDPQNSDLRSIQAIEMHCFLDFLISGAA